MKIARYLTILITVITLSCDSQNAKTEKKDIDLSKKARTDSIRSVVLGKNIFDVRFENDFGNVETLNGTNNQIWVTYYPKVNITLVSDKKTELIKEAYSGKVPKN